MWLEEVGRKPLSWLFPSIFDSRDQKSWLRHTASKDYKARFYDPTIKRFLNADPIGYGDGLNMYSYVGDSFVGGLLNDLQISIRRALDASMPKIAACAADKAIATAANVAMHLQNGYSVETMGGTTVVGLNSGARFGDYKLGAMGSFLYIQSAEETAIGTAVTGNIGSSGRSLGGLPSVSTSSSLGATTASLDTFMSGDCYGLGRGFRGFVGASGGVIKDSQGNFHPLVNLELGVGTAQEISTGVYSDFESCS